MRTAFLILVAGILLSFSTRLTNFTWAPGNHKEQPMPATTKTISYLALGDSYTIGESVEQKESFPYQLAAKLPGVQQPTIIAQTGWTTDELQSAIDQSSLGNQKFDLVTLLIGVNNQYRNYSADVYRTEFVKLLRQSIAYAKSNKKHVFVISIPDWGVTPYADGSNRADIAKQIDEFNAINKQESQKAGVNYIDITPISRQAATHPDLIAGDGLHPSAKMYALWVAAIAPVVKARFKE